MRILQVIRTLDLAFGGPQIVAINLGKAQSNLGHEVQWAAEPIPNQVDLPTIAIPHVGFSGLFRKPSVDIAKAVSWAEIIHLHGVWDPLLLIAAREARKLRRPYVVTTHGMLDPWSLQQRKWKKRLAMAVGFRRMLNQASMIHALNLDETRLLEPLGLTAPCAIVPNGIFLDDLNPPPNPQLFRENRLGPVDRPYILFLSRLHYKKGLDYLADMFAEVADVHPEIDLVVAGPDDGEERPFRHRTERLGLSNRVWVTGPLYGKMKWSAIAGATCFCLPSRQEGFSVAILEAMASGIPVIISDQCHFPEVEESGAGRIVPLEPKAIASAIIHILRDPVERQSQGQAGRRLVEERFIWPRIAERMIELYRPLISQGNQQTN